MCSVQTKGIAARISGTRGTLVWMNGVSPLNEICSAMSHELNRNHFYDGFFFTSSTRVPTSPFNISKYKREWFNVLWV